MSLSPWKDTEDETLRRMIGEGFPHSAIASTLGRSRNATIGRASRLGITSGQPHGSRPPKWVGPSVAPQTNWTAAEDVRLRQMIEDGWLHREIGVEMGRTRKSVIARAQRLKIPSPSRRSACTETAGPRLACVSAEPPSPRPVARRQWPRPATATAVDILGLTHRTCRMPLWCEETPWDERLYCGAAPAPGSVYCPACRTLTVDPAYAMKRKRP